MSDKHNHGGEPDAAQIAEWWSRIETMAGSRKTRGVTVAERRAAERQPLPPEDGRRQRRTGRDMQLNMKVKPEFRAELEALARAREIGLAEMLERILAEWKELGGKGRAR